MARKRPALTPESDVESVRPPYDGSDTEQLHEIAQEWIWRGRSGAGSVVAVARVLIAVSWALRAHDDAALEELGAGAARYLAGVHERDGLQLDPFISTAGAAYERIMGSVERVLTGENDAASRENAATWFLIVARRDGFPLPALPATDKRAIVVLVAALSKWRRKVFASAQEQAESWTRCMAEAAGRRDAANAAKTRMRKPAK